MFFSYEINYLKYFFYDSDKVDNNAYKDNMYKQVEDEKEKFWLKQKFKQNSKF